MRLYAVGKRIPSGSKNWEVAEVAKVAAKFERSTMRDQEASKKKQIFANLSFIWRPFDRLYTG